MAVLIFLGCLLGGIAIGLPIAWALLLCGAALMCNFAFFSGLFDAQFWAGSAQPKSPELTANC
ncbi:hypothetical protein HEO53_018930 [Escherichia coli]|nr:hypothetical protein [Escherichia coli]